MKHALSKATYGEYQASLFGACFIAFGLGMLLVSYFEVLIWPLILVGIPLHGWGMYRIYSKNK